MLYPSINEIRKKADSRYTIVILAAKRARDIIDGKPILTDADTDKPVSIAAKNPGPVPTSRILISRGSRSGN